MAISTGSKPTAISLGSGRAAQAHAATSAVCIVAVRDEAAQIRHFIAMAEREKLDVIVLDDGSSDSTVAEVEKLRSTSVIGIERRSRGRDFSLRGQMTWKRETAERCTHEWIIHADADEWLQSPRAGQTLLDLLAEAQSAGANAVDFEEFTFVPSSTFRDGEDPRQTMLKYYFHKPDSYSYMRAWRRGFGLDSTGSGGHVLSGDLLKVYTTPGILRHYPVLSRKHFIRKYASRVFSPGERRIGWHTDRENLRHWTWSEDVFSHRRIHSLECWTDNRFDRSEPTSMHFWYQDWSRDSS